MALIFEKFQVIGMLKSCSVNFFKNGTNKILFRAASKDVVKSAESHMKAQTASQTLPGAYTLGNDLR